MATFQENAKNMFENAKSMMSKGVEKGKDMAQIAKLNLDITGLESQIKEAKINIGDIVYNNSLANDNEEVNAQIDKINDLKKQIEEKKNLINSLK